MCAIYVPGVHGYQKIMSHMLELELWGLWANMSVLGIELGSFKRAANTLNNSAISPVLNSEFLKIYL